MKLIRKPHPNDGWYEITPRDAQELLDKRAPNRTIEESRAQSFASAIRRNLWRENGETIVFDEKDRCMDGQTRLRGCVLAAKPLVSYCVFGVPYRFFASLDTGRVRGGNHIAQIMGFPNANCTAATARLALLWTDKHICTSGPQSKIPNDRLKAYMNRHADRLRTAVHEAYRRREGLVTLIPISQASFLYYAVSQVDATRANEFLDGLSTGAGLKRGDAMLLFRERMRGLIGSKHRLSPTEKLALLVKTWNAYVEGRPVGTLRWNNAVEQFPDISNADVPTD